MAGMKGRKRKPGKRPAEQIEFSTFAKLHKGSPAADAVAAKNLAAKSACQSIASAVSDWSDPNAATPLQSLKFVKQLGQRNERAARHRARNRPSDN